MAKDIVAAVTSISKYQVTVQSARAETGKRQRILLIAPPKHGKTTTLASLSQFFPAEFPNHKNLVDLTDGFLIQFDAGGHDAVGARNLDMPLVDLSGADDATEIEHSFYSACDLVKQRVADKVTTFAGVDSVSELCTKLVTALKKRGLDGWDLWNEVAAVNTRMFSRIQSLPIDLVFTAHLVAKVIDADAKDVAEQTTKRWAVSLPGQAELLVDIPGKTAGLYRRNCSWIIPVVCTRAGKNVKPDYALYPNGSYGIEAGTRFPVNDKEPPNLSMLLRKVRANNNKQETA